MKWRKEINVVHPSSFKRNRVSESVAQDSREQWRTNTKDEKKWTKNASSILIITENTNDDELKIFLIWWQFCKYFLIDSLKYLWRNLNVVTNQSSVTFNEGIKIITKFIIESANSTTNTTSLNCSCCCLRVRYFIFCLTDGEIDCRRRAKEKRICRRCKRHSSSC